MLVLEMHAAEAQDSWAACNVQATSKYCIFVEIHGHTMEMNITDLITKNGHEGYEGEL